MKVLITGGAGFLGQRLSAALIARGSLRNAAGHDESIDEVILFDQVVPSQAEPKEGITWVQGDIADAGCVASLIDRDIASIFHLAAVVSGAAEADFELGMRINVDATRLLLERCRVLGHVPRVVMTSSVAAFATTASGVPITEDSAPTPVSSYGTQKVLCELFVNDYTRKGFIDGVTLRVPTVCVRPGVPNAAASSFASGIIREPLRGMEAICPVSADTVMWLMSPRRAIDNLLHAHEIDRAEIGFPRTLTLPGLSVSVGDMAAALRREAGDAVADLIRWTPDDSIRRIVASWPGHIATPRTQRLGFTADTDFVSVIREYRESLPT